LKSKLEKMKRIERLQKRIHELSTWQAHRLALKREELLGTHAEMVAALSDGLLSFGGAAVAATRRIRAIEVEARDAKAAHEAQSRTAFEQGMRARAAGRALQSTTAQARAEAQKKSLEELIEQSQRQTPGSVPRKP
jgi:RNase P/RNase MRP subunit p29